MSTDTETRLRAALRASAEVITDETPQPLRATGSRRRAITWPLLAAAAVVLAIAGLVLVVRDGGAKHGVPPVQHTSGPAPTLHPQACTVRLPTDWASAVSSSTLRGLRVLAVTDSGAVLAGRLDRPDVVLVGSNHARHVLYAAPREVPDGPVRVGAVALDGDWAAVSLITGGGQGALDGIVAINVKTGAVRTVRSLLLGSLPIVQEPVVHDGVVYWSEGLSVGPDHVYAYDLSARRRHTLDSSPQLDILGPAVLGGGVYWQKADRVVTYRAGKLPPGFVVLVGKGYGGLVTDGNRQAWVQQVGQRFVVKMRIGDGAPVTVMGPMTDPVQVTGVIGPYLLVGSSVLDTRTGATADLTTSRDSFVSVAGAANTIALSVGPITSPNNSSTLSLFDVAKLRPLRC